jgi:general secretion pathway protein G
MTAVHASVRPPRGFTLIELLVTVTIVALLSTVAFPFIELAQRRSDERELREALRQIRTALDSYKQAVDEGRVLEETKGTGYPPNLDLLVSGVIDAKNPKRDQKIYFLRKLPRDPLNSPGGPEAPVEWGLRSYASPPTSPQPGADIFDVYSLSQGIGLNGVAYRDW